MAEQYLPNTFASMTQAYGMGQQLRQQRQQEQDQNRLRQLAPQIIGGDPAAYAQAAAIDPSAAKGYSDAGDAQLRKLKGFINFVDQHRASGDIQAVNGALRTGAPFIAQLLGRPGPTEWSPEMDSGWEQLKAKVAMLGPDSTSNIQSTYVDAQGNRVGIMRDGTTQILGQNAPNNQIIDTGNGFYGVNKGNLAAAPVVVGGTPPQGAPPPSQPAMQQVQYATDDGSTIPPGDMAAVQAVMQAQAHGQDLILPAGAVPPPMQAGNQFQNSQAVTGQVLTKAPDPLRAAADRRAEEANARAAEAAQRAAAVAQRAEANASRGNAPAGFRFKPDGSLEPIPGGPKPQGTVASEGERNAAGFYQRMVSADNELENLTTKGYDPTNLRDYSTVGGVLTGLSSSEGQQYHQAAQNWVRANLRKESGAAIGVAEMEQEVKNYFPKFGEKPEVIAQKAHNRRVVEQAMLTAAGRAGPQQGAAPTTAAAAIPRATNPQTGEVVEYRNGAWVPVQ